ncbi:MAG: hypothetical protein K2G11_05765 [Muribaculaceae bacterium]|nr:hypothetical protein [Muribaculaceae bacterium]
MALLKKGKKNKEKPTAKDSMKATRKRWVEDARYGRTVSVEFLRYNAWLLLIFLVAILSLMGLRYKTKTGMEQIKKLTVELTRAESAKLKEKASYMSLIRESEMKRLVEEKGMNLEFQENPPEVIRVTD